MSIIGLRAQSSLSILILYALTLSALSGCKRSSPPPLESAPPPLSLSINRVLEEGNILVREMFKSSSGQALIRRTVLLSHLKERGGALDLELPDHLIRGLATSMPHLDKDDIPVYAWAQLLMRAELEKDTSSLQDLYQRMYPQGLKLKGQQVVLTPPQAWGADHYFRYRALFSSWARLRLAELRHQFIEGTSFSSLASTHSHHHSAKRGGKVSMDELMTFSADLQSVALRLRPGELSSVIQNDEGVYLFSSESSQEKLLLVGEGVFVPVKSLTLTTEQLRDSLLELRDSLLTRLPSIKRSLRSKKRKRKRKRKKKKKRRQAKKMNASLPVDLRRFPKYPDHLLNDLPQETLAPLKAKYHSQVPSTLSRSLMRDGDLEVLTRLPLFTLSPPLHTSEGLWFIRLTGRRFLPALRTPSLSVIALDLTQDGLKSKWGSWGTSMIGEHLWTAAQQGQLDEALSTLNLYLDSINPLDLPVDLVDRALSVDLSQGPVMLQAKSEHSWCYLQLEDRVTVSYQEALPHLIKHRSLQTSKASELSAYLDQVWTSLNVSLSLEGEELIQN